MDAYFSYLRQMLSRQTAERPCPPTVESHSESLDDFVSDFAVVFNKMITERNKLGYSLTVIPAPTPSPTVTHFPTREQVMLVTPVESTASTQVRTTTMTIPSNALAFVPQDIVVDQKISKAEPFTNAAEKIGKLQKILETYFVSVDRQHMPVV